MRKVFILAVVMLALTSCSSKRPVKTAPPSKSSLNTKREVVNVVPEFKAKPIYVPPEVVRVLIMPYEDDKGVLHQGEFVYFTLKDGYWTIAADGKFQRVKKLVRIVRTQWGLNSDSSKEIPLKAYSSNSAKLKVSENSTASGAFPEKETSCGPDCQKKLLEIKKYVGRK